MRVVGRSPTLAQLDSAQLAQEVDLSLEALHDAVGGGVPGLEEDGVQDFGGTDELAALDLVHGSLRAVPQRVLLRLDQPNVAEPKATLYTYYYTENGIGNSRYALTQSSSSRAHASWAESNPRAKTEGRVTLLYTNLFCLA